jgi:ectoine hydroxylase-related dioxygenase (phytanoyl-CoA dioxygenase family)
MAAIRHLPRSANPEDVAGILAEDGVVVVDRAVEPAVLDRAIGELEPHLAATAYGPDDFAGRRTKRTGGLIARSETCRALVMDPLVLGVVDRALSHSATFQLHLTQVISIDPGEPAQRIHRDQWAFAFFPFPKGYEVQCNTIWAVTDFTEENGATRVIPGSHRFDDRLEFGVADTIPAEMEKGSALLYSGSLYHGAGANRSTRTRIGVNLTYVVSWLRQEENQYLSVPFEVARTLPVDLLRVMGYARGAYALGYVDDLRDPISVVRPDLGREGLGDLGAAVAKTRIR